MIDLDRPLVVTDTETTGISARDNRIIEIGAMRVQDGVGEATFERLINPGISVPYRITRLTGITTAMVFSQPAASDVIPAYFDFLSDGILVAHNLSFDRGFLDAERARLGLEPMENKGLCTLRLARRLLPGLRSKSLGNLARFFRIPAHGRHRALRDVEVTVAVMNRLLEIAESEHSVQCLDELLAMQTRTYSRINPLSRHILDIRRHVLPDIPTDPGVYRMLDGRRRVLYVGKAKVLSNRVRSYFNAIEAHPPRIRELISKLRHIEWTVTGTELEALLLESEQIYSLEPPFNRAQRKTIARPFLRIGQEEEFPRITSHVFPSETGGEFYGPFRSRSEVRAVIEIIERHFKVRTCDEREFNTGKRCLRADINLCMAPCENQSTGHQYREQIDLIRAFLGGDCHAVLERTASEMEEASSNLAFEEAAKLRDAHDLISGMVLRGGNVAPRLFDDAAVIIHRDEVLDRTEVLFIRDGILRDAVTAADLYAEDDAKACLGKRMNDVFGTAPDRTGSQLKKSVNQVRVLNQWLFANRENVKRYERRSDETWEQFTGRVAENAKISTIERKRLSRH